MVNLNALQNISPVNLNTSVVTNDTVIQEVPNIFVTNVPLWLLPVTIILFIAMVWFIYKKLEWGLDIIQASAFASFINIILSYIIIKVGWSISIVPLTTWGVIWVILMIVLYGIKTKFT